MGKIIGIILLSCLSGLFLLEFMGTSNLTINDIDKDLSVYSDIIDDKKAYGYEIETTYVEAITKAKTSDTEKYIINDIYAYHQTFSNLKLEKQEYKENLVLIKASGNEYYQRVARKARIGNQQENVPFFKSYDESMYTDILDFWNNPMFRFGTKIESKTTGFSVYTIDLNANEKAYIESFIHRYQDDQISFVGDHFDVLVDIYKTNLTYIELDYSKLLGDGFTLKQKIRFNRSLVLNTSELTQDAIDLNNIEENVDTLSSYMAENETKPVSNDYMSSDAQLYFIKIDQKGEYKFTSTSDNKNLSFLWYLYDLEANQYKTLKYVQATIQFDPYAEYIYLNPGIYYIYLSPRAINVNLASISYQINITDDHLNSDNPLIQTITENSQITFQTDNAYDIDAFRISGDFDYVVIGYSSGLGFAYGNMTSQNISYLNQSYLIQKPQGKDIILYASSKEIGEQKISVQFYKIRENPIEFSEANSIDIYARDNLISALSFQGNVDRFKFTIKEHSSAFVSIGNAEAIIYNSNLDAVIKDQDGLYDLEVGSYFIEIYNFKEVSTGFIIALETYGKEIWYLPADLDQYKIQGFISNLNDIDLFQFTLDEDTAILFDSKNRTSVLVYGIDNPYMATFDISTKYPYFLPKGTYNLTLPEKDKLIYNFEMIKLKTLHETEFVEVDSVETSLNHKSYTYTMSFDFVEDSEKIKIHIDQKSKLSLEFLTGLRVNGVFTNDATGKKSYFTYTNTDPVTYIQFSAPGELVITFQTLVQYSYQELIYGDLRIIMNLLLEG